MIKRQALPLEKGVNFRDLGGYQTKDGRKIKSHKIIRSARLHELTSKDLNFLADYGVRYDVDFRTKKEIKDHPDKLPAGTQYFFMPVMKDDATNSQEEERIGDQALKNVANAGLERMGWFYSQITRLDSANQAYRDFFDLLLANDKDAESLLFHCTAGKDRTGMAAVYLLTALGVPQEIVEQDYLLSNIYLESLVKRQVATARAMAGDIFATNTQQLNSVSRDYLAQAYQALEVEYGGIDNYLHQVLGLTEGQKRDLRKLYLE